MVKAKVLYYKTRHLAKFVNKKVDKGILEFDRHREYKMDKVTPVMIEVPVLWGLLGHKIMPFYAATWKNSNPLKLDNGETSGADFQNMEVKPDKPNERIRVNATQEREYLKYYTPETQKALSKNTTLKTLMTIATSKNFGDMFLWIIMGVLGGYILGQAIPMEGLKIL